MGDINREYYRSKQEEQLWKTERDPIQKHRQWLLEQKVADAATIDQWNSEIEREMKKAVEFAIAAPYPNANQVDQDVYA